MQKAYQELESEGIIYTVGGKGCFVGGRESAAAAIRQKAMDELAQALRQGRLAGLDRAIAQELLEQCYGGGEPGWKRRTWSSALRRKRRWTD